MIFYILVGLGIKRWFCVCFVGLSWSGNNDICFMIFS